MQKINLTHNGGFPLTQNAIDFLQNAYKELFGAIGECYGTKTIITGMEVGGGSVAEGWLVYNGELIKFTACALDTKVAISETLTSVEFEDGLTKAVYTVKTAVCAAIGEFDFSDLKMASSFTADLKAQYDNVWLVGDVKEIDCDNAYRDTYFDVTGLGRLERTGWAICNGNNGTKNRNGRVSVGYDGGTVDPADNVWDVDYNTLGSIGGEKKHTLVKREIARHRHGIDVETNLDSGGGNTGVNPTAPIVTETSFSHYTGYEGGDPTGVDGNADAHENRQPFITTLFIQKI